MNISKVFRSLVLFFVILPLAISFQGCADSGISNEKLEAYKRVQLVQLPRCDCEVYGSDAIRYQEWYATPTNMLLTMKSGDHFISDYHFPFKELKVGGIIGYRMAKDGIAITDRIVRIEKDQYRKTYLVTKGDNNYKEGPFRIYEANYHGKVLCMVRCS